MNDKTKNSDKNLAAVTLGRLGGLARAKKLSKERLSDIGRKAAQIRWKGHRQEVSNTIVPVVSPTNVEPLEV
jgi:hypothetical protein